MKKTLLLILLCRCVYLDSAELQESISSFDKIPNVKSYVKPPHINQKKWNSLAPYFLPPNHPMRAVLDEIFQESRATLSMKHLKKAGFKANPPMKWTHLVVASHPKVPGYIFKIYLDAQRVFKKVDAEDVWVNRITGANLIRQELASQGWDDTFKVPRKWIYPLPSKPSPPKEFHRKDFILIEDDMQILSTKDNEAKWRSDAITQDILDKLYFLTESLGLKDCTKPNNLPFSTDGRISFVDTQIYYTWPVKFYKLTPHLSSANKSYWNSLIK